MDKGNHFEYYYGIESEQFSFYRIPRLLIKDKRFKGLSSDAKLLYGLMLDRMSLSMKNGWLDAENRVYIHYTIENIMEDLDCAKATAVKIMAKLDSKKGIGLIEKKRQGLGRPDIIYVKNFAVVESRGKIHNGVTIDDGMDEVMDYVQIVKENIEYDCFMQDKKWKDRDLYEELFQLICDVVCVERKTIRIEGQEYPYEVVKARFLKLNSSHLLYVIQCMQNTTSKIGNIKGYMLTALYNAPNTMKHYYQQAVLEHVYSGGAS